MVETVHPSMRYIPTLTVGTGIPTGMLVLPMVAYVLPNCMHVQFVIVAATLVAVALWL